MARYKAEIAAAAGWPVSGADGFDAKFTGWVAAKLETADKAVSGSLMHLPDSSLHLKPSFCVRAFFA